MEAFLLSLASLGQQSRQEATGLSAACSSSRRIVICHVTQVLHHPFEDGSYTNCLRSYFWGWLISGMNKKKTCCCIHRSILIPVRIACKQIHEISATQLPRDILLDHHQSYCPVQVLVGESEEGVIISCNHPEKRRWKALSTDR